MIRLRASTVGFKEWSVVCDALGAGRQSLILRKGGIAEGRGGFRWQASDFLLFPTHFHEQFDQTTWEASPASRDETLAPDRVTLRLLASIDSTVTITDWSMAAALGPFHVWKEEVVRQRFGYGDAPGLSLALLRIHRLDEPWTVPLEPRFGGCRSWLDLPEPPAFTTAPVLSDAEHGVRMESIRALMAN